MSANISKFIIKIWNQLHNIYITIEQTLKLQWNAGGFVYSWRKTLNAAIKIRMAKNIWTYIMTLMWPEVAKRSANKQSSLSSLSAVSKNILKWEIRWFWNSLEIELKCLKVGRKENGLFDWRTGKVTVFWAELNRWIERSQVNWISANKICLKSKMAGSFCRQSLAYNYFLMLSGWCLVTHYKCPEF